MTPTAAVRAAASAFSLLAGVAAATLFLRIGAVDGHDWAELSGAALIVATTCWLAWGAALALAGLIAPRPAPPPRHDGPITARTVLLVPVCNEDPVATFARVAAMDADLVAAGLAPHVAIAILSDSRRPDVVEAEAARFALLLSERGAEGRMFYRRRTANHGRKAGNIADFLTRSGAAWDFALVLDADSLMSAATIAEMIRRMEADPGLGLLQTLPALVRARTRFGRALQFSAALHSPVFSCGVAAMQGGEGPFWGHNAIFRIRAFASACGMPELSGRPPLGGHILSHDYVEAALLARAGWRVRLDPDLGGSFEEGPENLLEYARRDRRWCQGNLQHGRLIAAPGLKGWSRFVFAQNVMAYGASVLWLAFLVVSFLGVAMAPPPDYFPDDQVLGPVFPVSDRAAALGLAGLVVALLVGPKVLILAHAVWSGRAAGFGGGARVARAMVSELALSSLLAPVLLAFQVRAVAQVLAGRDGGWPANDRTAGQVAAADALPEVWWIMLAGAVGLLAALAFAPVLVPWLMPVAVPMLAAPWLIAWTSRPAPQEFVTPQDRALPPIVCDHLARMQAAAAPHPAPVAA